MSERDAAVRVDGLGQLVRDLRAAGRDLEDLKDANQTASRIVLEAAQRRAPRRSGRLADSGRINRAAKQASVKFGGASVPYAGPIHWGYPAKNIPAQPFVVDAADETQPVWLATYEQEIQKVIDEVRGA